MLKLGMGSKLRVGITTLISMFASSSIFADVGIDEKINLAVKPYADAVAGFVFSSFPVAGVQIPFVLVWLIVAATVFTVYFNFINIRAFKHGFALVRGDYHDPEAKGEVTHFQALATALSGTVGLGNIAGVAIAVSLGGPGATFWMILAGFLGMSSKFTECTLGVKYRNELPDGSVSGGPMYYLTKGLAEKGEGFAKLGKVLAVMFAIFCVGGAFGVVATLVGLVIMGGIKGIARVTSKIVPFMAVVYVTAGLIIILMHFSEIPAAFAAIWSGAFTAEGISGGVIGVLFQGFKRAAFSNEAGVGSAAIAHSAVQTSRPVTEGFVALYEPFIDTIVVCTITALVIIITGTWDPSVDPSAGVQLTSDAFASTISWFPWVLTVAVVLFAFSTMISWSYYGLKAWTFLFGDNRATDATFKLLFLFFVVVGSSMQLGSVIDF